MKTVVGLYNSISEANQVKSALVSRGYDSSDIHVIDQTDNSAAPSSSFSTGPASYTSGTTGNSATSNDESVGTRIKNFFGSLAGHDEDTHRSYAEGISGGGALVAVNVDDNDTEEVADFLEAQGARQIQGGAGSSSYAQGSSTFGTADGTANYGTGTGTLNAGTSGTSGYGATGTSDYGATGTSDYDNAGRGRVTGEQVIPVVAEELEVGKRQVQRGGVRVFSRIVSEPVSESVNLHDERVVVDRRPVDREATEADFNTREGAIEITATGEEAVIGKRSRVVEEVVVGKQATDRTEEVTDTVRHTEVDVEPTTTANYTGTSTGRNTDLDR